jgi:RNA polymerase sigma factor (sigma-70 family)
LIESFASIAHHLVKRYAHWSLEKEDIFQIAMLAVIKAIDGYEASLGVPLGAHVALRIKYELGHEVAKAVRLNREHGLMPFVLDGKTAAAGDNDDHAELWDAIDLLPKHDRAILISCFGLAGRPAKTLVEISKSQDCIAPTIGDSTRRSIRTLRAALSA